MVSTIEKASPSIRPKDLLHTFHAGAREIASDIRSFPLIVSERIDTDRNKAQNWLTALYLTRDKTGSTIFTDGEIPIVGPRIASGWWFTIYGFETYAGRWVLKIGHKNAPQWGYLAPSHEDFPDWYEESLVKQHATFDPYLPHLILPQKVDRVSNGEETTTLIVQPYISHGGTFKDFTSLPPNQQRAIIREYELLIKLSRQMRQKNSLQVDLFGDIATGTSNLAIARLDGETHLVLLDNGPIDLKNPAPVVNAFATGIAVFRAHFERTRFQTMYTRNSNHR